MLKPIFSIVFLSLSGDLLYAAPASNETCSHNFRTIGENWKTGAPSQRVQLENQGWVENFSGVMDKTKARVAGLYWNTLKNCEMNQKASAKETYSLHCAGVEGRGYFFDGVDSVNDLINIPTNLLDEQQEELVFLEASSNIHRFATCQKGLYSSYFGKPAARKKMLTTAYKEFNRVNGFIHKLYNQTNEYREDQVIAESFIKCTNEARCGGMMNAREQKAISNLGNAKAEVVKLERKIDVALAGIPMANREEMKEALKNLAKHKKDISLAQFTAVFDGQMRKMSEQVDKTVDTFAAIKRTTPDGKVYHCIDGDLKKDLYRSGQVQLVLDGFNAPETLGPLECRMGKRYGIAGEILSELAIIPTYFMGYGLARLAGRIGLTTFRGKSTAGIFTAAKNMGMMGLNWVDLSLLADSTVQACLASEFMTALQERGECNPEFELERTFYEASIGQCLTSVTALGISTTVATASLRTAFKEFPSQGAVSAITATKEGKNLREVVPPEWSKKNLPKLVDSATANPKIEKIMADDAELAKLGLKRWVPGSSTKAEANELTKEITKLEGLGKKRTKLQEKALASAKTKLEFIKAHEDRMMDSMGYLGKVFEVLRTFRTPARIGPRPADAAFADDEGLDRESYVQVVYDDVGNLCVLKKDGTWYGFKHPVIKKISTPVP